jgi:hypothetical protein
MHGRAFFCYSLSEMYVYSRQPTFEKCVFTINLTLYLTLYIQSGLIADL